MNAAGSLGFPGAQSDRGTIWAPPTRQPGATLSCPGRGYDLPGGFICIAVTLTLIEGGHPPPCQALESLELPVIVHAGSKR
jgi:hypothetical protein